MCVAGGQCTSGQGQTLRVQRSWVIAQFSHRRVHQHNYAAFALTRDGAILLQHGDGADDALRRRVARDAITERAARLGGEVARDALPAGRRLLLVPQDRHLGDRRLAFGSGTRPQKGLVRCGANIHGGAIRLDAAPKRGW